MLDDETYKKIIKIAERHVKDIKENPIEGIHDEEMIKRYEEQIQKMKDLLKEDSTE